MKYFTLRELTYSLAAKRLGIPNNPNAIQKACLVALVDNVLDPLRTSYGKPIVVTSGYRCPKLNSAVGGAKSSQHTKGQAADIRSVSDSLEDNMVIFNLIIKLKLPFDQLIFEFGDLKKGPDWVHVSYGPLNRRQILYSYKYKGVTYYKTFKQIK